MLIPTISPSVFKVQSADFDGTNDHMARGAELTGNADGKVGTLSYWLRADGGDSARQWVMYADGGFFASFRESDNKLYVAGFNSAATQLMRFRTNTTITAGATWHHLLASWDLAAGTLQMYLNDVSDIDITVGPIDGTIDYTRGNHAIGASLVPGDRLNGCLAEFYMNLSTFTDFSVEANRRKFRTAGGKPNSLGANGAGPTGAQPIVYFKGPASAFPTNRGTGGNYTVTGTLTDGSTNPSD